MSSGSPLIRDFLPELCLELKKLLIKANHIKLAESVDSLEIIEKCACGVKSCASFYTAPKPIGGFGAQHKNLILTPQYGFMILDVVDDEIRFIEIHDRPKYKKLLDRI